MNFRRRIRKLSCKALRRVRIKLALKIKQLEPNNIFQLLAPQRARELRILKGRLKYVNRVYRRKCKTGGVLGNFFNQVGPVIPIPPPPSNATIPGQPYTSLPRTAGPVMPLPGKQSPVMPLPPAPSVPFHTHNIVNTNIKRTGGPLASPYRVPVPRPAPVLPPPMGGTTSMSMFSGNSTWFNKVDMK